MKTNILCNNNCAIEAEGTAERPDSAVVLHPLQPPADVVQAAAAAGGRGGWPGGALRGPRGPAERRVGGQRRCAAGRGLHRPVLGLFLCDGGTENGDLTRVPLRSTRRWDSE